MSRITETAKKMSWVTLKLFNCEWKNEFIKIAPGKPSDNVSISKNGKEYPDECNRISPKQNENQSSNYT